MIEISSSNIRLRADGRMSLNDWASLRGICLNQARILCRQGRVVKARKEGNQWWIDYQATETLASLIGGNSIERNAVAPKTKPLR